MDKRTIEVRSCHGEVFRPRMSVKPPTKKDEYPEQEQRAMSCFFRQPCLYYLSIYGDFIDPLALLWVHQVSELICVSEHEAKIPSCKDRQCYTELADWLKSHAWAPIGIYDQISL